MGSSIVDLGRRNFGPMVMIRIGEGTGYFRVRAWDGLKRETVSEVRSFTID